MTKVEIVKKEVMTDSRGAVYKVLAGPKVLTLINEIYMSEVTTGVIKGWKRHNKMNMNLIAVCGETLLVTFEEDYGFASYRLSLDDHKIIRIPSKIWFAFMGLGKKNVILNMSSIQHDPEEEETIPLCKLNYQWPKVELG